LRSAVNLFWAKGYDGTSLQDLQEAMGGIQPPSLYAAFGSKEELFHEALDLYRAERGGHTAKALMGTDTAKSAIGALLRSAATVFTEPGTPKGCMILTGMTICSSEGARARLRRMHLEPPELIRKRLQRGVDEGDLPAGLDLEAVAAFYATVLQGMSMRARDGASRKALLAVSDLAMAAWPWGQGAGRRGS